MRSAFLLAMMSIVMLCACTSAPAQKTPSGPAAVANPSPPAALKQPSDPFTVDSQNTFAAMMLAVYQCQQRGYDNAEMQSQPGLQTATFVCTGMYPADLQ